MKIYQEEVNNFKKQKGGNTAVTGGEECGSLVLKGNASYKISNGNYVLKNKM